MGKEGYDITHSFHSPKFYTSSKYKESTGTACCLVMKAPHPLSSCTHQQHKESAGTWPVALSPGDSELVMDEASLPTHSLLAHVNSKYKENAGAQSKASLLSPQLSSSPLKVSQLQGKSLQCVIPVPKLGSSWRGSWCSRRGTALPLLWTSDDAHLVNMPITRFSAPLQCIGHASWSMDEI